MMARSKESISPVVLISGAAGGIGAETAQLFRREGWLVFGTSRRATTGSTVDGVEMVALDVTDDASVGAAVTHVQAAAGRIDVLINNAGLAALGAVEETPIELASSMLDANVLGTIRMIKAVLSDMRAAGRGRIVTTSSVLAMLPSPFNPCTPHRSTPSRACPSRWTTRFADSVCGQCWWNRHSSPARCALHPSARVRHRPQQRRTILEGRQRKDRRAQPHCPGDVFRCDGAKAEAAVHGRVDGTDTVGVALIPAGRAAR